MKIQSLNLVSQSTFALCAFLMLAPSGMATEKDTLNETDVKFVKNAAADDMAEVRIAQLGVQKAGRADIKEFAEMLVKEHTSGNENLEKLAKMKGVELSAVIAPKHADAFQKLENVSGTEFDKAFLAGMVSDHKMCVSNFATASKDVNDGDVKMFVIKMLPTLQAHLAKAEELSAK